MENDNINKKDFTKEKIILFVIGVLVGAVISATSFLICVKTLGTNNDSNSSMQMPGGNTPPEMPSGENGQNSGTPPEMPSGENNQNNQNNSNNNNNNSNTPPAKPNSNNNN